MNPGLDGCRVVSFNDADVIMFLGAADERGTCTRCRSLPPVLHQTETSRHEQRRTEGESDYMV